METGLCSPSNTLNRGATPLARNSFNCSVMYCVGFCLIADAAVSDIVLLLWFGIGWGNLYCAPPGAGRQTIESRFASNVHEFGIVLLEYGLQRCRRSLFHRVNVLNQLKNVGRHNEQIPRGSRPRIPIGMWSSAWHHHTGSRAHLDFLLAHLHAQHAFQHIPGFVIAVMNVRWRNQSQWLGRTTCIAPLGYHEMIACRAERISSKWRYNRR